MLNIQICFLATAAQLTLHLDLGIEATLIFSLNMVSYLSYLVYYACKVIGLAPVMNTVALYVHCILSACC